jgi:hypothetical protein
VADALPKPAIAARHQCHHALQVHRFSPLMRMRGRIATTPPPLIPCRAIRQGNIEFAESILSNDSANAAQPTRGPKGRKMPERKFQWSVFILRQSLIRQSRLNSLSL